MKRCIFAKLCMTACLILGLALIPVNQVKVQAAEVIATVHGTILSGTTSDLLKLSTKEGKMEIKLDTGTDTSECKILLPEKIIYVSVSHGNDGYLHAVKITSDTQSKDVTTDTSATVTVTGTIGSKSTDSLIYLKTPQGEMQIKLDPTTSMSGCSVLVPDKKYDVTCARGSDAYMHAISISDTSSNQSSSGSSGNNGNSNADTLSIKGTAAVRTKRDLLYLSTDDGEMQFKIDSDADTSKGLVVTAGNDLTVSFYRGSDAYLHASAIVGDKDSSSSASIDTSSTVDVTGTVGARSNQNLLYLDTKQGVMKIKLDAVSSVHNSKVLVSDMKITVTCARGSDAYLHATSITAED